MSNGSYREWFKLGKMVGAGLFVAGMWLGGLTYQVYANTHSVTDIKDDIRTIRDGQIALLCKLVPEKCPVNP